MENHEVIGIALIMLARRKSNRKSESVMRKPNMFMRNKRSQLIRMLAMIVCRAHIYSLQHVISLFFTIIAPRIFD